MFDDGYMIIGTKKEMPIFIDEVMEYIEE